MPNTNTTNTPPILINNPLTVTNLKRDTGNLLINPACQNMCLDWSNLRDWTNLVSRLKFVAPLTLLYWLFFRPLALRSYARSIHEKLDENLLVWKVRKDVEHDLRFQTLCKARWWLLITGVLGFVLLIGAIYYLFVPFFSWYPSLIFAISYTSGTLIADTLYWRFPKATFRWTNRIFFIFIFTIVGIIFIRITLFDINFIPSIEIMQFFFFLQSYIINIRDNAIPTVLTGGETFFMSLWQWLLKISNEPEPAANLLIALARQQPITHLGDSALREELLELFCERDLLIRDESSTYRFQVPLVAQWIRKQRRLPRGVV